MSLIIDYPWYFWLLCLLAGVLYSGVLYFLSFGKRGSLSQRSFSRRVTVVLSVLRFLSVSAITALLLAPMMRRDISREEKPIVVIAEDNSKSLDYSRDSAFYHTGYADAMDKLADELADDYEVHRYSYGSGLVLDGAVDYHESSTDIGSALDELAQRYYHRNVGALLLTGDGIYNHGPNPQSVSGSLTFPVYTVALGDTTVRRDAAIADVRYNRIAYLGNDFPIEVSVSANHMRGEQTRLTVSRDGQQLYSELVTLGDEPHRSSVSIRADKAGLHNYVVEIGALHDELTLRNNRRIIPVEVIDGHQKIAIIAATPHPDVAALRAAIEGNENYVVESFLATDKEVQSLRPGGNGASSLDGYNLLILHGLPSKVHAANVDVAKLLSSGVPALFVLGSGTDLARFNALHLGMEVVARINRQNEVTAVHNRDFTFFSLDGSVAQRIERFPPLLSPFGDYRLGGMSQILFSARLGNVQAGLPLVAVAHQQDRRYAFISGEGLWRWRLADYQANGSHEDFDALVNKLVSFTALRVNKERFHVELRNLFSETEEVVAEAQLYNDNYELVNAPDVSFEVATVDEWRSGKVDRALMMNRNATGYMLNMGSLPPGSYRYRASTKLGGQSFTAEGSFLVEDLQLEALNLVADHSLLNTLSATTGGAMLYPDQLDQLPGLLKNRDDIKTVLYSESRYVNMLNVPLLFVFIVLLLAAEWVIRKLNYEF